MSGAATQASVCISNSLGWYETVFQTHGLSGTLTDGVWTCRGTAPPYYSNAMTVARGHSAAQIDVLRDLARVLQRPFSVKDSFAAMDLGQVGMHPRFEAEWVMREQSTAPPGAEPRDLDWRRVISAAELERWEAAWRLNGSPADRRVFLPALLAVQDVALFAAYRSGRIVAGCAANRTSGAVGFSNFFSEDGDKEPVAAAAVAETIRFAPGVPVVGYERGEDLARVIRLGFLPVGPLRIILVEAEPGVGRTNPC